MGVVVDDLGAFHRNGVSVPDSASGCNQDVCIDIEGLSLIVTEWSTTAFGNVGCTFTQFQGGRHTRTGDTICPDSSEPGVYFDTTGPTGIFEDGLRVCNVWNKIGGRPCETIEK